MEGAKILVILEDSNLQKKISEVLTMRKYNVNSTHSGKRAMDIIRRHPVDMIISGIKISEIDGFGVLGMVNKFVETAGIGFIMLLNEDEQGQRRRVMEMGADGYLMNPFDHGELLNQIEVRIRKKRFQRELFSMQKNSLRNRDSKEDDLSGLKSRFSDLVPRKIKRHQVIYYPGDSPVGLYHIISGKVKTYVVDELGNEFITGIYGPGDYFGLIAIALGVENMESAEAIDISEVSTLKIGSLDNALSEYPELSKFFFHRLAREVNESHEKLLDIAYYSVRKRIAKSILKLSKPSKNETKGRSFSLPRNDLACTVGIATETLSRVLGDFLREGLIDKNGNEIILKKPEKLKAMKN
nr:response regulator [Pedobacter sp. ASV2]